jgi:hypothetical protein
MKLLSMPENGWIKNNFLIYYIKAFLKRSAFFYGINLKVILMIYKIIFKLYL